MKPTKIIVNLSYKESIVGGKEPYRIESVKNDIGVQVNRERYHVGDFLTEVQASELLSEPNLEVTTVIRK